MFPSCQVQYRQASVCIATAAHGLIFDPTSHQFSFCCTTFRFSFEILQSLSMVPLIPSLHFGASHAHQERSAGTDWPHRENSQANSSGNWSLRRSFIYSMTASLSVLLLHPQRPSRPPSQTLLRYQCQTQNDSRIKMLQKIQLYS